MKLAVFGFFLLSSLDATLAQNNETTIPPTNGTDVDVDMSATNGTMPELLLTGMDTTMTPTEDGDALMEDEGMMTMEPTEMQSDTDADETASTEAPNTQSYTCSAGGPPTSVEKCTEFTGELNNVECGCYYFCDDGTFVHCLDDGEEVAFACSGGGDATICYEKAGTSAPEATPEDETREIETTSDAVDSAKEAWEALYYTASVALAALICVA